MGHVFTALFALRVMNDIGGDMGVLFMLGCCFGRRGAKGYRSCWAKVGTVATQGTGVMPNDKVVKLLRLGTGNADGIGWADKRTGFADDTLFIVERDLPFIGTHAFSLSFQMAQACTSPSTMLLGVGGHPATFTSTLTKRSSGPSIE